MHIEFEKECRAQLSEWLCIAALNDVLFDRYGITLPPKQVLKFKRKKK